MEGTNKMNQKEKCNCQFIGTLLGLMILVGYSLGPLAMVGSAIGYMVALLTIPKTWKGGK